MSGQTVKYNLKKRLGRGFTFEELKVMSPGSIHALYASLRRSFMLQEQLTCAVRSVGLLHECP